MSQTITVIVPDIGDFKDVEVIEVLVKTGDQVSVEQSLLTVESDKASMEIPSSHAGMVKSIHVKLGDKVSQGSVILELETSDASAQTASPVAAVSTAETTAHQTEVKVDTQSVSTSGPSDATNIPSIPTQTPSTNVELSARGKPHASPSVRKYARTLGVVLANVKGTGFKRRITQEDVTAFVKGVMQEQFTASSKPTVSSTGSALNLPDWPSLDFEKFGPTHLEKLSRIQKISGPSLARNWVYIPHVTQFDQADITALEAFRQSSNKALEKKGIKLTMLAFVMVACANVLRKFPRFNSSLDAEGENLIIKDYYHFGFAADTPQGLVVPVVRDVDKKSASELAKEVAELAATARDGKLKPAQMQGASFTISSLGGVGGTAFTPIINAPEVAILGLSKSSIQPVWDGKQFAPRLVLPLSLSYDHRVIDGAQAARFTTALADILFDMRKVLI